MAQLQSGGRAEYSPCRANTMSSAYEHGFSKRWSAIGSAHWSLQTPPHHQPRVLGATPSATPRPLGPASIPSLPRIVLSAHTGLLG